MEDRHALRENLNAAFRSRFDEPFLTREDNPTEDAASDASGEIDEIHFDELQQDIARVEEAVSRTADRVENLEDTVEDIDTEKDSIDIEERFEDALDRFQSKLEQIEQRLDDHEENRQEEQPAVESTEQEPTSDESEQDADSTDSYDADTDLECPQCGDEQSSVRGLSSHTSRSQDHNDIASFFRNDDGQLDCPLCPVWKTSSSDLSMHFSQEHNISMVQYYVEHYDDLTSEEPQDTDEAPSEDNVSTDETEDTDTDEGRTKECSNCGYENPLDRFNENDDCPECGEPLETPEFDRLPKLLDEGIVEPDLPYTYEAFKDLDRIEQAAAVYTAGLEITKGDSAEYADTVLKTEISSTSSNEAQYIYRIITQDLPEYFEEEIKESMYGRDKTRYKLTDALPAGVEELDTTEWTVTEFKDLPDTEKSEIVLRSLADIQPASREDVQNHIYADGEDPNGQIRRLLTNYLIQLVDHDRRNGEKQYRLTDEVENRLQDDGLSLYQAQEKYVSGRSQYICEDCGSTFESSSNAKQHRRSTGHLNWNRKPYLPYREKTEKAKAVS